MKKIGREVLFLKAGENNPRNGESTLLRAKDGRILFAYTEYVGDSWQDHAEARISVCESLDEGETWSTPRVLISKPADAQNIMSPSLIRTKDGAMGMVYLRKDVLENGGVTCMPLFIRSEDEGETWSQPRSCGFPTGYYCVINDGVTVTEDGRIYVPASYTGACRDVMHIMKEPPLPHVSDVRIAYSDDHGQSWQVCEQVISSPFQCRHGLFEPGIFEHEDGVLWLYARTTFGHQYQAFSYDRGASWTAVTPNCRFTSPDSPMRVKRLGAYVGAIYNPIGYNCLFPNTESWSSPKRTPIVIAVSSKDGKDLSDPSMNATHGGFLEVARHTYLLEDDLTESYCYPSAIAVKDGILISYYHSDGSGKCLHASKIVKIGYEELDQS
ncbi:MAG: exo-alpha-sialidase [Clostridia bacterium]|nr:exo-alpha-sialidase [Clostridia bacterium]